MVTKVVIPAMTAQILTPSLMSHAALMYVVCIHVAEQVHVVPRRAADDRADNVEEREDVVRPQHELEDHRADCKRLAQHVALGYDRNQRQ